MRDAGDTGNMETYVGDTGDMGDAGDMRDTGDMGDLGDTGDIGIVVFEGANRPKLTFCPSCHEGTTISFTESLTKFCCFYALLHKIIL